MGLGGSKGAPLSQTDSVEIPSWASETDTKVYFDIEIDGSPLGRIEMGLAKDIVPKTYNFVAFIF